jgi:DNA-binding GntR family transcriptional regulator
LSTVYNRMTTAVPRPPETRSEVLVDALRDAILTGRYAPGSHLVQEDLAVAFGVSRIPLREALRRLEGEGLVIISPNRGAIVRPLAPKDVVDLYDVRLALESLAVRRAAERFADLRASTEERRTLARRAVDSRQLPALFRLDRDFHAELAAASDNPHLVAALNGHWSQIMRVMHAYFQVGNYPTDVWHDHREIAAAVATGDAAAAVALLRTHLEESRDRILAHLRSKGDAA